MTASLLNVASCNHHKLCHNYLLIHHGRIRHRLCRTSCSCRPSITLARLQLLNLRILWTHNWTYHTSYSMYTIVGLQYLQDMMRTMIPYELSIRSLPRQRLLATLSYDIKTSSTRRCCKGPQLIAHIGRWTIQECKVGGTQFFEICRQRWIIQECKVGRTRFSEI